MECAALQMVHKSLLVPIIAIAPPVGRGIFMAQWSEHWQLKGMGSIYSNCQFSIFSRSPYDIKCVFDSFLCIAIDGDGMVVALTFVDGRVHLRSRFVASRERLEEQEKRKFLYRGQMGTHPNSALKDTASFLGNLLMLRLPKLRYRNPSNTNVYYWGGKVCMRVLCIHGVKNRVSN